MSSNTEAKRGLATCGIILFIFPIFLVTHMMLDGWAISKLWLWFVAEPFSVSPLTVAHCIGLSMLLSFALRRQPDLKKDDKDATAVFATIAAWWILTPITTVLLGWVVKSYLMV